MIWKFAVRRTGGGWLGLYYNSHGFDQHGFSTKINKTELQSLAITLPRVSRQIYSETATMIYSENTFAFQNMRSMNTWLSKRLLAQREAIRYMMVPPMAKYRCVFDGENWKRKEIKVETEERVRILCPSFVEMEEGWLLDDCLYHLRGRGTLSSSGDEAPYDEYSD